jgi:hypothetical protein
MTHSSSATQPIAHRPTGRQPHPPSSKPRHDGTPVKRSPRVVMAEAARRGRLYLDYRNRRGREQSYVSRTLRLALLAPDLDKGIVAGTADQAPVRERLERLPTDWCEQGAIHPRAPDDRACRPDQAVADRPPPNSTCAIPVRTVRRRQAYSGGTAVLDSHGRSLEEIAGAQGAAWRRRDALSCWR